MLTTIIPGKTPCLACIYPKVPETVRTIPVLGIIPAVIGNLQAMEAIKLIADIGTPLASKLLLFNGTANEFLFYEIKRRENCEVCG